MITIREASIEDLQQVLDLYSALYGEMNADDDAQIKKIWTRIMTDQFYHVIVAEKDGKLVSTCTCVIIQNLTYEHRPHAIIENLVTDSRFRTQGLATACIEEAKRIAMKENCYNIMLCTTSKLESTLKFYEKHGFTRNEYTAFSEWL